MSATYRKFDPTEVIRSQQDAAELLSMALREGGHELMMHVLDDVVRAVGMGMVAGHTGLGRESLYKTLRPGKKPRFDTMVKILDSLGLTFTVQVKKIESSVSV
jgi:probable addiction module antidote protein